MAAAGAVFIPRPLNSTSFFGRAKTSHRAFNESFISFITEHGFSLKGYMIRSFPCGAPLFMAKLPWFLSCLHAVHYTKTSFTTSTRESIRTHINLMLPNPSPSHFSHFMPYICPMQGDPHGSISDMVTGPMMLKPCIIRNVSRPCRGDNFRRLMGEAVEIPLA
ncbi:hypothetical protein H6P81_003251 [Aristolochia fimbriata]|uniref:Uncharacterized protein n=1 Tax=Aristolochia fimbriata TaxID=158543 RepID=A0AAV7FCT7_ARIFI|nr:hypothetical protein H6P81_003251 [Aristolochia fimbriata]